jgi:hypothetical protein
MKSIAVLLVLLGSAAAADAQTVVFNPGEIDAPATSSIVPFLEGTDVFWTIYGEDDLDDRFWPYRLEADLFPHLVVLQDYTRLLNLDRQVDEVSRRGKLKRFAYAISGTPAVRLRMLRSVSAPVRTPSYMPRGNVQIFWLAHDMRPEGVDRLSMARAAPRDPGAADQPRAAVAAAVRTISNIMFWEGHFIVGHHSNGQEGCIATVQERDPETGDCVPAGVPVTRDTINEIDGSFSTNYMRAGVNYVRYRLAGAPEPDTGVPGANREQRIGVEFEYHPRAWVDDDIVDLIGRARVNARGAYAWRHLRGCRKRLETGGGLTWNPGVAEGVDELSYFVQASCYPAVNGGWGYFVRVYSGQDYYNIGFLRNITRLQVGLTFNQTDWFRFRRNKQSTN